LRCVKLRHVSSTTSAALRDLRAVALDRSSCVLVSESSDGLGVSSRCDGARGVVSCSRMDADRSERGRFSVSGSGDPLPPGEPRGAVGGRRATLRSAVSAKRSATCRPPRPLQRASAASSSRRARVPSAPDRRLTRPRSSTRDAWHTGPTWLLSTARHRRQNLVRFFLKAGDFK
jgi:hypothetical protein